MEMINTKTLASVGIRVLLGDMIQAYVDVWVDCRGAHAGVTVACCGHLLSVEELNRVWAESLEPLHSMDPGQANLTGVKTLLDQIATKIEKGLREKLPNHTVVCQDLGVSVSARLDCPPQIQATFNVLATFESLLNGYKATARRPLVTYSNLAEIPGLLLIVSSLEPRDFNRVWMA